MKYTIDHQVEPSCYLWLDNLLVEQGSGFATFSGSFRSTESPISGLYAYASPHRQFVYDSSVPGAVVPTGVYVGSTFTPTGANTKLDFYHGGVLFSSSQASTVSARYSYKEVNVYFMEYSEEQVLFENKLQNSRSLPPFENYSMKYPSYPCIFIRGSAGENETLCFDGCAATTFDVRLIFLADSRYLYRAVTSLLRDQKENFIPLFGASEMPFNEYFSLKTGAFDYSSSVSSIQADSTRLACIKDVTISNFTDKVNSLIGPNVIGGFIDLELELVRFPRS